MDDGLLVNIALRKGYLSRDQIALAEETRLSLENRGVQTSTFNILLENGALKQEDAWVIRKSLSNSSLQALEIEGYVIQGRIGSGGMGDVFKGVNAEGHTAAVKLLSARFSSNAEYLRRFEREVRAAMRLDHPHIAKSFDSGTANGSRYILMELVEGETLKTWIDTHGPLSETHGLILLQQLVSALDYSWSRGVLHRDIKPANIILGAARPGINEPFCAKIIDFGLAKVSQTGGATDESHGGLTGAGLALGTPHYMSPEQASGQQDLDQRCDIYGLGASLYHALLGHTMFSGKNSEIIMFKQVSEEIDLSEMRNLKIHSEVISLLSQMLIKNRYRRIGSWPLVAAAITRINELKASSKPVHPGLRQSSATAYPPEPANLDGVIPHRAASTVTMPAVPLAAAREKRFAAQSPEMYLLVMLGILIVCVAWWAIR